MSAVGLHPPCDFLEEPQLLGRFRAYMHRASQERPCKCVRDRRVTGHADRLSLTRPKPCGVGEPGIHPFIQIPRGALTIPAAALSRLAPQSCLASGVSHHERRDRKSVV